MAGQSRIIIKPQGRMANQMLQLMLALELQKRIGEDIPILGYDMPEWGLTAPPDDHREGERRAKLHGVSINIEKVGFLLRTGLLDAVEIHGWGMRLEHYRSPAPYAALFQASEPPSHRVGDDELLLHVRAGDILSSRFEYYFPMPYSYYRRVIEASGLRPVFIGELLDDNSYVRSLRQRFPDARFLAPGTAVGDFETIRNARHVALSVSSFSWLATWLSATVKTVHMPVCGLFSPLHSNAFLLPANDPRYRFYDVPFPSMAQRRTLPPTWLEADHEITALDNATVADLCCHTLIADRRLQPADR